MKSLNSNYFPWKYTYGYSSWMIEAPPGLFDDYQNKQKLANHFEV